MFPKKGTAVPQAEIDAASDYATMIAKALRAELGTSARATKTLMHWTGASDRAAKYWLSGARGPDGRHLVLLARHSESVLRALLRMAHREAYALAIELGAAQAALTRAMAVLDALKPPR